MEWIEQLKGEAREKLLLLCREAGFVEQDIRSLSSFRKGKRIEAAYRLGGMRASEAVPQLLKLLARTNYGPLAIIIARAIAKSADQPEQIRDMLLQLLASGKPIHALAADILLETRLDSASLLRRFLDDPEPGLVKVALVAMWGRRCQAPSLPWIGSSDRARRMCGPRRSSCTLARIRCSRMRRLLN